MTSDKSNESDYCLIDHRTVLCQRVIKATGLYGVFSTLVSHCILLVYILLVIICCKFMCMIIKIQLINYVTYMRSLIEYASTVWSPHLIMHVMTH